MDSALSTHGESLATQGYTIVTGVLSSAELEKLRDIVDARATATELAIAGFTPGPDVENN